MEVTFDHVYLMFGLFIKRLIQHYDINDDSVHWTQHIFTECDGTPIVDFIGKYENLMRIGDMYASKKLMLTLNYLSYRHRELKK